jgi:DNA-binding HxlR family transcriptional regulator
LPSFFHAFFFINSSVRKVAAVDLLRYRELERKVVGITATMLTKCLRELEQDKFIVRKQYNTIPPTVEYSLAERGKTLIPALESVYQWAEEQMET